MKREMKLLGSLIAFAGMFALASCANQALQHDYEGDVHLRWMEVTFAPMDSEDGQLSGNMAEIAKIWRQLQNVSDMLSKEQQAALQKQLLEFQDILVAGIRDASGVPVVASEDVDAFLRFNDQGRVDRVTYDYPRQDGAYMNIYGGVNYKDFVSTGAGVDGAKAVSFRARPRLDIRIDGYTADKNLFWRHSVSYLSDRRYDFGNVYILGVPVNRIVDGEILLIPLAEGITKELQKQKAGGEL